MGLWSQSRFDAISTLPNCLKNRNSMWLVKASKELTSSLWQLLLNHITNAKPASRVGPEWAEKKSSAGSRGAVS